MPTPDTDAVLAPDAAQSSTAARSGDHVGHACAHHWRRDVADFVRGPAGHSATLGFFGALMITFGGFGAGSVRRNDPLLEAMHLSWLRFGHGLVLSSVFVWIGVIAMITAWVRLGRIVIGRQPGATVTLNELRAIVGVWIFPLLFAVPMFSRDAYSYLAQGAMLHYDINPYVFGPSELKTNVPAVLDNVSPVWLYTTAPYGPIFLLIGRAIISVTGDNVVAGTIALRLVMLPGLALMVWAVPHLTKHLGGKPTTALWLAVLNPLVLIHLIGGVHNEMLMVGLMAAGIALVLEHHHAAGIVVVAVGVAVKATAGVALPFLVWIWMIHERERRASQQEGELPHPVRTFAKIGALGVAVFAAVFAVATWATGLRDHQIGWLTALSGSKKIINWLSLPTIMAHMVTWVSPLTLEAVLPWTRLLCMIAMVAILVWAWWRFKNSEREAVLGILVAFVAIVILSPAALPWYYSWPLALAAGFALSTRTLQVLVGLGTWLMLIFQPDGAPVTSYVHGALAIFAAVAAALSLYKVDPLKLRAAHPRTEQLGTPVPGPA
ncbi:alpha-(1-_6)-mannopyranosyltransferase A [Nocardia seriolae]|uniref:alpha-(1->6)-mannopyranosyltransferase A n=1 Tax=Nocardia seriolae TaxID=37332 RepID=UPI00068954D1|nr:alpha-(1->6)-mannopyranosyltransferase A [Nocardia seriolae]MTJ62294.1 alpha-(1->6)-mannopyranosyltransferase A [Nocardia seriolae]MTJ70783.1 alpha-(1->6)-mannopyranosyltransferase A [Nocardia seriolae]MTJ87200.1 alpha-(1->6)-mannopyranosyltransferase A [Nocardia seriolae]MTK31194.1 alpha-(1->6)-mannopyranosyltransferase A [Nocardia seriolae]MTK40245.1 alpha-(1->6)-mannopyranosyltransferase A [Nocardia seriolae]